MIFKMNIKNDFLSFMIERACLISVVSFIFFIFFKRVIYPDISFDSINYHFFLGKSGIESFPKSFSDAEFFPLGIHSFNPLPDLFSVLFYEIFGYRFGTILSFLSLLGIILLCVMLIRKLINKFNSPVIALMIFPVLTVNESLFQVATYMTDNLLSFLTIFALYCVVNINFSIKKFHFLLWNTAFWISIGIIATKLTNIIYAIPLFLSFAYRFYAFIVGDDSENLKVLYSVFLLFGVAICLLIPGYHWISVYADTGNPVFPYYNSIFKSEYYPKESWAFGFGPKSIYERIFYPFVALLNPERLGEVKDLFPDVKLIILFLISSSLYVYCAVKKIHFSISEKIVIFVAIFSFLIWQFIFGYSRYAISLEFMLGVVLIVLLMKFQQVSSCNRVKFISFIVCAIFIVQGLLIASFNIKYDISWRQTPKSFESWASAFFSLDMFEKYTKCSLDLSKHLSNVDVVIQCVNPSSAYFKTIPLLREKPLLNFEIDNNFKLFNNYHYVTERNIRAKDYSKLANQKNITFAMIINDTNKGLNCSKRAMGAVAWANKHSNVLQIDHEFVIDNFVGDMGQNLTIYIGMLYI